MASTPAGRGRAKKAEGERRAGARSSGDLIELHRGGKPEGELVEVDPLQVKIAVLTEALGTKTRTAEILGVARSQPGKWLTGKERPNPRARRLIQDFEYVWDRLTDERAPEVAHEWLRSANAYLNGATPLTWLRTRGPDDVIAAIDAEEAGSYA